MSEKTSATPAPARSANFVSAVPGRRQSHAPGLRRLRLHQLREPEDRGRRGVPLGRQDPDVPARHQSAQGPLDLAGRFPGTARDHHRRRRARGLGRSARPDRDRDAARGLCRAAHQPGAADVSRAAGGRRRQRRAGEPGGRHCSSSTASRGTTSPSPPCAGPCTSSRKAAISTVSPPSPIRRAKPAISKPHHNFAIFGMPIPVGCSPREHPGTASCRLIERLRQLRNRRCARPHRRSCIA